MALDFSKLRAIPYKGNNAEKQRTTGEELLDKGFTCIGGNTPFSAPPETVSAPQRATPAAPETIPLSATAPASAPQRAAKEALMLEETRVNVSELLRKVFNYAAECRNIMERDPEDQLAIDEAFSKLIAEYMFSPTMREDVRDKVLKIIEAVEILIDVEHGERLAKRLEASGK